jgi:hypothetical protein
VSRYIYVAFLLQDVTNKVQQDIQEKKLPMDFDTVMGLVVG